jgi:hypothetical protein
LPGVFWPARAAMTASAKGKQQPPFVLLSSEARGRAATHYKRAQCHRVDR